MIYAGSIRVVTTAATKLAAGVETPKSASLTKFHNHIFVKLAHCMESSIEPSQYGMEVMQRLITHILDKPASALTADIFTDCLKWSFVLDTDQVLQVREKKRSWEGDQERTLATWELEPTSSKRRRTGSKNAASGNTVVQKAAEDAMSMFFSSG